MMMLFHKVFCSVFGIGYMGKGGGSVAALMVCVVWLVVVWNRLPPSSPFWFTCVLLAVGVWSSGKMEGLWGKDSSRIVVDECAGMCVSLLWIPVTGTYILISFLLFRFFDIVKPLFIRRMERLPAGWGVMGDDLLAGVYANIVLRLIMVIFWK